MKNDHRIFDHEPENFNREDLLDENSPLGRIFLKRAILEALERKAARKAKNETEQEQTRS